MPRVEENTNPAILPTLEIVKTEQVDDDIRIIFEMDGTKTLVVLNDVILGVTEETEITISGLQSGIENKLILVPLGDDVRGEGVEVDLAGYGGVIERNDNTNSSDITVVLNGAEIILPKAPNTGKR